MKKKRHIQCGWGAPCGKHLIVMLDKDPARAYMVCENCNPESYNKLKDRCCWIGEGSFGKKNQLYSLTKECRADCPLKDTK